MQAGTRGMIGLERFALFPFLGAPRMLYETAERFNLEHNKAFVNINHSHPPYHHPVRISTSCCSDLRTWDRHL